MTEDRRRAIAAGVRVGLLALLVWAADQGVKSWVRETIALYSARYPIPFLAGVFRLTHLQNTGVAFGLLQDVAFVEVLVVAVFILAVFVYVRHMPWDRVGVQVAAGLQLGGALGNLTDRVLRGYVTDYLDFYVRWGGREYHYPPFNLADACIVVGMVLLLWLVGREPGQEAGERPATVSGGQGEDGHEPVG